MAEVVESKENGSENQKKKKKGEEKKMCSLDIPLFNTKRRVHLFVSNCTSQINPVKNKKKSFHSLFCCCVSNF